MSVNQERLWNRNFVAICLSSFFLFMTYYILAVTLPLFVTGTLHGSQSAIGPVMTVFILAAVVFRPLSGRWIDMGNRRLIVGGSLALFALCTLGYSFVNQYEVLLGLRLIHGIGFGIATTATASIAVLLVPESRKGEGIGYFSLFMSLAMVIGPFLGLTILGRLGYGALLVFCVLLAIIGLLSGLIVKMPEPLPGGDTARLKGWRAFIEPAAVPISIVGFLSAFSYSSITTFLSVYADSRGLGAAASYFFMVFALMILISRPFTGKIFDRIGPSVLVYPGIALFAAGMIALSQASGAVMLLTAGALLGLGFGALLPSYQTIAVQSTAPHRRGLATATFLTLFDFGFGIGSSALGITAAHAGYSSMYLLAGILIAVSAAVYYVLHQRRNARLVAG